MLILLISVFINQHQKRTKKEFLSISIMCVVNKDLGGVQPMWNVVEKWSWPGKVVMQWLVLKEQITEDMCFSNFMKAIHINLLLLESGIC